MNNTVKQYAWRGLGVFLFTLPLAVAADVTPGASGSGKFVNPLVGIDSPVSFLNKVVDALIQIGVVVIVLAFIWAGFKFVTAMGDTKQVASAQSIFTNTAIGAAILLGAKVITTVIQGTVNQLK